MVFTLTRSYLYTVSKMVSFLLVAVLAVTGLHAQQDFDDVDPQWSAGDGISPLDSLAYWDTEPLPDEDQNLEAQGCCLPKTWTATLFSEVRREGGKKQEGRSIRFAETAYVDQNNRRVAEDVTVPRGPRRNATKISYIILFSNNNSATVYAFSKAASKCFKKVLPKAQFRPMCLPQNSTLQATYTLGAGARALRSQSWGYLVRDRRAIVGGSVVLTPDNCVPILVGEKAFIRPRMTVEGEEDEDRKKRPVVITFGALYTNFATTIRDPSVFTPPSYCKKADDTVLFDENIDFTTIIQRYVTIPE